MPFQRLHEPVAVDDARRRRQVGGDAGHLRLERSHVVGGEPLEIVDAIHRRIGGDGLQLADLIFACGDEELAATSMRHAVLGAEAVELLLAGDAQLGAQAAGRVIDAGVDNFRAARACLRADAVMALEQHDALPFAGQCARNGEADDAGADHHRFKVRAHA